MLQAAFQMSPSLSWSKAFGFNTFQNGRGRKSWASGEQSPVFRGESLLSLPLTYGQVFPLALEG